MPPTRNVLELTYESFVHAAPESVWVEVAAVFQATFSAAPYYEDPEELAQIIHWGPQRLASDGGRLVVARHGMKVVGFSLVHGLANDEHWERTLSLLIPQESRAAELLSFPQAVIVVDELAVDAHYRGRGIAKACLAASLSNRTEAKVVLGVFEQAEQAMAMYKSWGFDDIGTVLLHDGVVKLHVLTGKRLQLRLPLDSATSC